MSAHSERARSIFSATVENHSPEQWPAYLDEACGNDVQLRLRVEDLLRAHEKLGSFHDQGNATGSFVPLTERTGTMIGRYKLMEQIGEGGMGVVYVAEQQRPVRRKVALKIIKPGMDTRDVVARFEAERQALALMDHPNIARVLDGGATESGRPYFVMELVRGIPITEYCDRNKLTTRQRLELFAGVCQAIQHAHQKGIVHRDVKPSNVMVTLHDGTPVPKVIDFGVAKAINQQLTERTIYTRYSQMVGTPLYMSPEQAELSGLDLDTRTDIYSLGVLLYELLTGDTPFDKQRIHEAAYDEIRRIIREEEPPKPSTKVSTLGETAADVSGRRSTDPKRLCQSIRGDLDWIVMKALEKDRGRRYESASSFAADVRRFLDDEAIEARPPSMSYRLRKFVRRNKRPVAAVSVVLLAVVVAITVLLQSWQWESKRAYERLAFLYDDARAEAIGGDRQEADAAIERLRSAGAPESWIEMLKGLVALYGGGADVTAINHLRRAVERDPTSIASKAMLATAYAFAGDAEYYDLMNELEKQTPRNELERFLLGQALTYRSTLDGWRLLDEAVGPGSPPLFHAIRADALMHHSLEMGDLNKLQEAIRYLEAVATLMPDDSYVLGVDLCAHSAAIQCTPVDATDYQRLCARGAEVAGALERFTNYPTAASIRAHFYETIGEEGAFLRACLEAVDQGGKGYVLTQAAAALYRVGRYGEARDLVQLKGPDDTPWVLFGRADAVAFTEEGQSEVRRIYKLLADGRSKTRFHIKYHIPETVLLQQEDDEFRKKKCEKRLKAPDVSDWERAILYYTADKTSDEDLLIAARSSLDKPALNEGRAHKLIGMRHLLRRNRDKAKRHFKACLEIAYLGDHRDWGAAMLARLESDETWPP